MIKLQKGRFGLIVCLGCLGMVSPGNAQDSFEEWKKKDSEAFRAFVGGSKRQGTPPQAAVDETALDLARFAPDSDEVGDEVRKPDEAQAKAMRSAMSSLGLAPAPGNSTMWGKGSYADGGTEFQLEARVHSSRQIAGTANPAENEESRYYNTELLQIEPSECVDTSTQATIRSQILSKGGYGEEWKYFAGCSEAKTHMWFCKVHITIRVLQGTKHYPVETPAQMTKEERERIIPLVDQGVTNAARNCVSEIEKLVPRLIKAYADQKVCNCTRPPVIILPGVAGTELFNSTAVIDNQLWPFAYGGSRWKLRLQGDGSTPAYKSNVITGTVLRRNFIAAKLPKLKKTNFYGPLINFLTSAGFKEGKDLVTFPYDWRLDNDVHFGALDEKVDDLLEKTKREKVALVAHSMGGLIASGYVRSDPARAEKIDYIITLGTPFWGSPKVYYGLIAGYNFSNSTIRQPMCKILFQDFPACYQLLPRVSFITDTIDDSSIPIDRSFREVRYKFCDRLQWLPLPFPDLYIEPKENDWRMNVGLLKKADRYYEALGTKEQAAPMPAGVELYSIMGCGIQTLGHYLMRDWTGKKLSRWTPPLAGYSEHLGFGERKVIFEPQFENGDGTVPMYSLNTDAATKSYYLNYHVADSTEHASIPSSRRAQAIVGKILDGNPPDPAGYADAEKRERAKLDSADYTLHSDALMRVIDKETEDILGYDDDNYIREDIPTGTFLDIIGSEYATVSDTSREQIVHIRGIRDGSFTLIVDITRNGRVTTFYYPDVPVQKGTVATIQLTPDAIKDTFPEMTVKTGDEENRVPAQSPTALPPA